MKNLTQKLHTPLQSTQPIDFTEYFIRVTIEWEFFLVRKNLCDLPYRVRSED